LSTVGRGGEEGEEARLRIIREAAFFHGLTDLHRLKVADISRLSTCEAGDSVYNIGDPARDLYVLIDGSVRLAIGLGQQYARGGDILRHGDVFGWAALTPHSPCRIASASCLSRCQFLSVDGAQLLARMEQDHTLGYRIMVQLTVLITGTFTAFVAG
jgi:CRP-like cAMP-binding protein